MFLRETDFVSADKRLRFSRTYNSNQAHNTLSSLGNGWQGELDARHILTMDQGLPSSATFFYVEASSTFATASDACVQGWPQIVAGGSAGKADPKWAHVTATYNGAGQCNLSNGQSVTVLSTAATAGMVGSIDVAQYGITVRRGDGTQYLFYCSQGVCHTHDSNAKFIINLDTAGYSILDDEGNTEHYDTLGFLSTLTYKDGYQLSFVYNNDNAGTGYMTPFQTPVSISDNHGRAITFGYDSNGLLSTLNTPDGSTIGYGHDAHGRLTSVTYPTGTRSYQYTNPNPLFQNLLTGLVDENSNLLTTWTYDSIGRATNSSNAGGTGQATLVTNTDGTTTVTDALGTPRTYAFQSAFGYPQAVSISGPYCANCGVSAFSGFDGSGFLSTSKDWNGNITQYTFDSTRGLPTKVIEAQNSATLQRTTNMLWDPVLPIPTETTVFDAGNVLKAKVDWKYSVSGEPVARCEEDPNVSGATNYVCTETGTAPAGVRRWTYNNCSVVDTTRCPLLGLLMTVTDPLNKVTTQYYYTSDDPSCASAPATCPHRKGDLFQISRYVTSTLSLVTTFSKYDGAGRPIAILDNNNVETDLSYNGRGWLTQIAKRATNGTNGPGDQVTGYGYDNAGNLTRVTHADNSNIALTYDPAHRLTDVTDYLGNTIHYTLDAAGNRTREDTKDPSAVLKRSVVRQYNALGQLAKTINADGTTTNGTYAYDTNGNPNVFTDGRGTVTNTLFDALNRAYHVEQDPGTAPHVEANTGLTYDALDRLTQVQDPHGLNTQYQYDGLNDLTQLTSPDTGVTNATYDAAGNVLTRTDARGIKATYTYDTLNRVATISYPTAALKVTLGYDTTVAGACAAGETYGKGRLTSIVDGSGNTRLCYDRFGRMVRKTQTIGTTAFQTAYAYDLANHLTQVTTPKLTKINYTRDAAGRVSTVTYRLNGQTTDTPVVKAVTYYPFGPVASITYNNNRVLKRTYDQDYVISSVTDTTTGGLSLTFGRDAIGNLTQYTGGGTGNKYVYDGLNRLTGVTDLVNNPVWTYTYDATGNRLSKKSRTSAAVNYTYGSTSHELQAVGSTGRGYDAMGDTTSIGTNALSFVYDNTGRMSQVNTGAANTPVMQYATNALGQRVEKLLTGNTAATQYSVDDEAGHALGDYDTNSARILETIWMDGMPVGVLNGSTGTLAYIEPDHLGTPRTAIDATSNLPIWNWSLVNDAFGETAPVNLNGSMMKLNLRLPGQSFDAESGLSYNYFRDYDASVGRYVESDPLGLIAGPSTFGYVGGNPIKNWDPYGLKWWPPALPDWAVNASAGLGDGLSFGATAWARHKLDIGSVNECSKAYSGGQLAAIPVMFMDGEGEAKGFFEGAKYSEKVLQQMANSADIFHAFPESVTAFEDAGTISNIVGGDMQAYQMLEIPGSYAGYDGVFQFIQDSDGVINHRLFVPTP